MCARIRSKCQNRVPKDIMSAVECTKQFLKAIVNDYYLLSLYLYSNK